MAIIDANDLKRLRHNLQVLYSELHKRRNELPKEIVWHDERLELTWVKQNEDPNCLEPYVTVRYSLPFDVSKTISFEVDDVYGYLVGIRIFL